MIMNKHSMVFIIPLVLLGVIALLVFSKVSSLEQELSLASQDNTRLKDELSSKDKELNATKIELVQRVNELNSTKEELNRAVSELNSVREELNSVRERLTSTEHELSSTKNELNITKDELINARRELNDVKQQYNILNDRVKQLEEQLQGYTYREDKGDMVTSYAKGYESYKTLIEPIIALINNRFKFPYNIPVEVNSCSNADYSAYTLINYTYEDNSVEERRVSKIVLCKESIEDLNELTNILYNHGIISSKDYALKLYIRFIVYHELGHAMIRIADMNTGSREESLVDDFALYMLIKDGEDINPLLALYKELARLEKEGMIDAKSPSSLYLSNQQRYHDYSCLAHGAGISSIHIDIGERGGKDCRVIWYEVSNGWSKTLALWTI
jgi:predicted  nucleic acid-binding Zn-ribbon protein